MIMHNAKNVGVFWEEIVCLCGMLVYWGALRLVHSMVWFLLYTQHSFLTGTLNFWLSDYCIWTLTVLIFTFEFMYTVAFAIQKSRLVEAGKLLAPHCDWMLLWFVLDHESLYEVWVENSIKYTIWMFVLWFDSTSSQFQKTEDLIWKGMKGRHQL